MKVRDLCRFTHLGILNLLILSWTLEIAHVDGAASGTFMGDPTNGDCPDADATAACEDICPEGVCDFEFAGMTEPVCLCNNVSPGGAQFQCTQDTNLTPGGNEPCDFFAGIFPPNDPTVPTTFNCITNGAAVAICAFSDRTFTPATVITDITDSTGTSNNNNNNNNSSNISNTGLINCAKLPTQFSNVGEALFCLVKAAVVKLKFLFLPKIIIVALIKLAKLILVAVGSVLSALSLVSIGK